MSMKRYDIYGYDWECDEYEAGPECPPDADWVKYEDVQALDTRLSKACELLNRWMDANFDVEERAITDEIVAFLAEVGHE